jgi:chromosome segregation ATPase
MEWELIQPFILPIIGSIATYIVLVKKLEFEIQQLKEESRKHAAGIERLNTDILVLKENGSIATVQVDKRVVKLEEEFASMKESLNDIRHKMTETNSAIAEIQRGLTRMETFFNTQVERRTRGRKQ